LTDSHRNIPLTQLEDGDLKERMTQLRDNIMHGDLYGVPLLVDVERSLVPDYGMPLPKYVYSFPVEFGTLKLSLVSIIVSLYSNKLIGSNIQVNNFDVLFHYRWSISFGVHLIEINWDCYGCFTCMNCLQVTEEQENKIFLQLSQFTGIPPLQELHGEYVGFDGFIILLDRILVDDGKFSIAYKKSRENSTFKSIVQVYPVSYPQTKDSLDKCMNNWSSRMSKEGMKYSKVLPTDTATMDYLNRQFLSFSHCFVPDLYPIPSDYCLVALEKNTNDLIAIREIPEDQTVTYVPVTFQKLIPNDSDIVFQPKPNHTPMTLVKKVTPFGGFGAFTKWRTMDKYCNCVIRIEEIERNLLVKIVATKPISRGEYIICKSIRKVCSKTTVTNPENLEDLKEICTRYHAGLIKENSNKEITSIGELSRILDEE